MTRAEITGCRALALVFTIAAVAGAGVLQDGQRAAGPDDHWSVQLTVESLDRWRDYLLPEPAESDWQDVEWRSQFWQGVIEAQIQGKPILLWAMNGHPMGCV